MRINFNVDLNDGDLELLKKILHCENENQLVVKMSKLAHTSFEEIIKMIIGQKVFTRGKDILEYRLFNLVKFFFDGKIPKEQQICDFFQVTATESRSLIRSVISKYQYELKDAIFLSLKEQIQAANFDSNSIDHVISIHSLFVVDELNKILGSIDSELQKIEKKSGTISTYIIKPASYDRLCNYFGLNNN